MIDPGFQRHALNEIKGLTTAVVPVDVELLDVAVGALQCSRRKTERPRSRNERQLCANAVNALRIDTLLRHQAREQPPLSHPPFVRAKLMLGKTACSEAMGVLLRHGRYHTVKGRKLPCPRMPGRAEEIGNWSDERDLLFVPIPECALWLSGPDFTLLSYLHFWAETWWDGKRQHCLPLAGPVAPDAESEARALEGFGRDRLQAGLDRLLARGFVQRRKGALWLAPKDAQHRYVKGRPEGELPLARLKAGVCPGKFVIAGGGNGNHELFSGNHELSPEREGVENGNDELRLIPGGA